MVYIHEPIIQQNEGRGKNDVTKGQHSKALEMSACKLISLRDCDKVESPRVDAGYILLDLTTVKQSMNLLENSITIIQKSNNNDIEIK